MLTKHEQMFAFYSKSWHTVLEKNGNDGIISASFGEGAGDEKNNSGAQGGESLENYAKAVLYAYPLLKTVRQDYEIHIRNKAVLSYRHSADAETLAEYLAGEILDMRRLEWLKGKVEFILDKLNEEERTLLSIRYFGKGKKIKGLTEKGRKWSERNYFRRQRRLSEKVGAMLCFCGVTKELFLNEFARLDIFKKIYRFVEEGKDKKISAQERRNLRNEDKNVVGNCM